MHARPALLLALLAVPGLAGAQSAPMVQNFQLDPLPPVRPGGSLEVPVRVEFCYSNAAPPVAGTVQLGVEEAPAWATATLVPESFPADSGGQRCGTQEVVLRLALTRDAPAFTPGFLRLSGAGRGSTGGSSDTKDTTIPVQADYWAEVQATQGERPRVARGDQGQLRLTLAVGANGGTKVEVTGVDAQGKLSVLGASVTTGAGHGLDARDRHELALTVTASPGASLGVQRIPINITTHYALRPDIQGERAALQATVEVTDAGGASPVPAPAAGLALAVLAGAAVLAARRRR